jgi:hypothetical protein
MDQPQAKPPRKRRRGLIVALLLVLGSGVAWWYWPRGDARFVGKWRMVGGADVIPNRFLVFHNNGDGEYLLGDGKLEGEFDWRASESACEMGMLRGGRWPRWQVLLYRVERIITTTPDNVYEITSSSHDSISLRAKLPKQRWGEFMLERVAE